MKSHAQVVVIGLLYHWQHHVAAGVVTALLFTQILLMRRLLSDPLNYTPWYNATGTTAYVLGMLAAAMGLGGVAGL